MFSDERCVDATLISGTKETCSFFIFEVSVYFIVGNSFIARLWIMITMCGWKGRKCQSGG